LLDAATVLTAAHVVAPTGADAPPSSQILVEIPWLSCTQSTARATCVHPEWAPGAYAADFATIRIAAAKGLGLAIAPPDPTVEAFLYGYPAGSADPMRPESSFQSGFLQPDGLKLFSDGFHVLSGMSGAPFVQTWNDVTRVVGLATWDADAPAAGGFKGLPLDSSYLSGVWPMPSDD
jgi:hypothetical protein